MTDDKRSAGFWPSWLLRVTTVFLVITLGMWAFVIYEVDQGGELSWPRILAATGNVVVFALLTTVGVASRRRPRER